MHGNQKLTEQEELEIFTLIKENFLQYKESAGNQDFELVVVTNSESQADKNGPEQDEIVLDVSGHRRKSDEFHDIADDFFPESVSAAVPLLPEQTSSQSAEPTPVSSSSLL